MSGLIPYINAPCLVTYHEVWGTVPELFAAPVVSLMEYGVFGPSFNDWSVEKWHHSFPNVLRLSIRARSTVLTSVLNSPCRHPNSLPALQTISAKVLNVPFIREARETMEDLVRVRNEACNIDIALYFEAELPYRIPPFFGEVVHCLLHGRESLTHVPGPASSFLKVVEPAPDSVTRI